MEENRETIQINKEELADEDRAGAELTEDEKLEAELAAIMGADLPSGLDADGATYAGGSEARTYVGDTVAVDALARDTIVADHVSAATVALDRSGTSVQSATEAGKEGLPDESRTEDAEQQTGLPPDHPEMGELRERIEQRRKYKERKKRRFRARFYVISAVFAALTVFVILSLSGFFTIDSIEVKGNSQYTAEEIINIGHAVPGRNLIYDPGSDEIEEYLEQNPYIRSAEVSRKLPSTLVIKVKEREEKFAFPYDDDYLVMDEDGILLRKSRSKPKITIVEGIIVNKIKLGEKTGTESGRQMDRALRILKTMSKSDLYFVKIDMSKEKTLRAYIYDTLVVRGDYDLLTENMKNGRLHQVLEKLFEEGIKRGTITFDEDGSASFMPII